MILLSTKVTCGQLKRIRTCWIVSGEGSRTDNRAEDSAPHSLRQHNPTATQAGVSAAAKWVHIDMPHTPVSNPSCGNLHKCHLLAKINNLPPPHPTHPSRHLIGKTQPGGICWAWNWFAGYFRCELRLYLFLRGCWRWESPTRWPNTVTRDSDHVLSRSGSGLWDRPTRDRTVAAEKQHLNLLCGASDSP